MMNQRNLKRIFLPKYFFGGMKIHSLQSLDSQKMLDVGRGCVSPGHQCPFSAHFVFLAIQGAQRISNPPALHDVVMLAGTSCRWYSHQFARPTVSAVPPADVYTNIYRAKCFCLNFFFCKTNRHTNKCSHKLMGIFLWFWPQSTLFSYVRAHVTSERVNAAIRPHVRPLVRTRPSTRTHTSVHSYVTRPSTRTSTRALTRTLGRTHVRHHVHLYSYPLRSLFA